MPKLALIIPTYNAQSYLDRLLPAIASQIRKPDMFLVIDSSSRDRTADICRAFGATVHVIPQSQFDHGGTRQLGIELTRPCDIALFLTHDAIPASSQAFKTLVAAFQDETIGMAYGRQLPHLDANPMAAHARLFNYPDQGCVVSMADRASRGIRVTFASDSFCAYRVAALDQVGGFPDRVLFGEDMLVAARMLVAGWRKAYVADSAVQHSHNYTMGEEFRRYFDVGALFTQQRELLRPFGRAGGEGARFVRSEIGYLMKTAPWLVPSALARTMAKMTGYRVGRLERLLPVAAKKRLSMSGWFWR